MSNKQERLPLLLTLQCLHAAEYKLDHHDGGGQAV